MSIDHTTTRFASPFATGDAAIVPVQTATAHKLIDTSQPPSNVFVIKGQDFEVGEDGTVKIDGKPTTGPVQTPSEYAAAKAAKKKDAATAPATPKNPPTGSDAPAEPEDDVDSVGSPVQEPHTAVGLGEPAED